MISQIISVEQAKQECFRAVPAKIDNDPSLILRPEPRRVQEALMQHGISPTIAGAVAVREFFGWPVVEMARVLRKVRGLKKDLKSFEPSSSWQSMLGLLTLSDDEAWITAPDNLVKAAAQQKQALCVNSRGVWAIKGSGYFAISHVWEEGIQADGNNRGLRRSLLESIFTRLNFGDSAWIWLDCLAIPSGNTALTLEQEKTKAAVINSLAAIYRNAETVIILDAMCMRLAHDSLLDVGVCLALGKWISRIWTYQEALLAPKALIVTGKCMVDFEDVVLHLQNLAGLGPKNEAGNHPLIGTQEQCEKYHRLWQTLTRLVPLSGDQKPSLQNIANSCTFRLTGNDVDYSRAFFPLLGLEWKPSLTRDQGMKLIYDSQKYYAKTFVLMHGVPRSIEGPGWAPAYLRGVRGEYIEADDIEWERRGLRKDWYTYPIRCLRSATGLPAMKGVCFWIEIDEGPEADSMCICEVSILESQMMKNEFCSAVGSKIAYVLSNAPLTSEKPASTPILLVEKCNEDVSDEVFVCMTALLQATWVKCKPVKKSWLISHVSPILKPTIGGGGRFDWTLQAMEEHSLATGFPLHDAVRSGNISEVERLLNAGSHILAEDSRKWTPLHVAALTGNEAIARLLIDHHADVNAKDDNNRTPLMIAAEKGNNEVIKVLFTDPEIDVNAFSPRRFTAMSEAITTSQVETVKLLLAHGADKELADGWEFTPCCLAMRVPAILEILLEAGADPRIGATGLLPIHNAARNGYPDTLERVLSLPGINILPADLQKALEYAVKEQQPDTARILLYHGTDPDHTFTNSEGKKRSLLATAIELGHFDLCEMLLDAGASMNGIVPLEKSTVLHIAAANGRRRIAKLLMSREEARTLVRQKDDEGRMPAQLAKENGFADVAEILSLGTQ